MINTIKEMARKADGYFYIDFCYSMILHASVAFILLAIGTDLITKYVSIDRSVFDAVNVFIALIALKGHASSKLEEFINAIQIKHNKVDIIQLSLISSLFFVLITFWIEFAI